jgi:hypothetical protein
MSFCTQDSLCLFQTWQAGSDFRLPIAVEDVLPAIRVEEDGVRDANDERD